MIVNRRIGAEWFAERQTKKMVWETKKPVRDAQLKCGFTLIELLVTVSVIGLLSAIMLPAISQVKSRARQLQCGNNQRQLALVWMMYCADNTDRLVANGRNDPPSTSRPDWVQGAFFHTDANWNDAYIRDPQYALFANYVRDLKIYLCPTDRQTIQVNGQTHPRTRSYQLNLYLGWEGDWDNRLTFQQDSGNFQIYHNLAQVGSAKGPSEIFSFIDVNPDSICWPFFGVYMDREWYFNYPNSSHSRGGLVGFCDGHVAYHRWEVAQTLDPHAADFHAHADISMVAGNTDLAWLRTHTSVSQPLQY